MNELWEEKREFIVFSIYLGISSTIGNKCKHVVLFEEFDLIFLHQQQNNEISTENNTKSKEEGRKKNVIHPKKKTFRKIKILRQK